MLSNITGTVAIKIAAPAEQVWAALTTPDIIKQYFFGTEAISDWKAGSAIYFQGEWEGKKYQDKGTILDVEPNKLFRFNYWSSMSGVADTPENYVVISYYLDEDDDKTILTIIEQNIPCEKMKAESEQNWNKAISGLKNLLEQEPASI
jgi:uncharacterized protein YndB with AHSA1/START domain